MDFGKEQKRALKASFKRSEKHVQQGDMLLDASSLDALLGHLDEALEETGCDHSLKLTLQWAEANAVPQDVLASGLMNLGGYCDCEVLANVDPDSIF